MSRASAFFAYVRESGDQVVARMSEAKCGHGPGFHFWSIRTTIPTEPQRDLTLAGSARLNLSFSHLIDHSSPKRDRNVVIVQLIVVIDQAPDCTDT